MSTYNDMMLTQENTPLGSLIETVMNPTTVNTTSDIFNMLPKVRRSIYWVKLCWPVNLFPVTSLAMVIVITKRKKSSEANRENWEATFSSPHRSRSSLEISINELWCKELWGYRFW